MNLTENDLKKAHQIFLYMLKRIDEVCSKYSIQYWLEYGTLLGAIRHNGFIPWDDDCDICMFREDYEKFNKIIQAELKGEFFWQTHETDPQWFMFIGKLRLNGTQWVEPFKNAKLKSNGLWVDVFVSDPAPDNPILRFLLCKSIDVLQVLIGSKMKGKSVSWKQIFLWLMPNPILPILRQIVNALIKIASHLPHENKKLVTQYCVAASRKCICSRDIFKNFIRHPFEKEKFYIPADFDKRLSGLYGDYMTPPPENERCGHGTQTIDYGNFFKKERQNNR